MRLESGGGESSAGMAQVQTQLAALTTQLQEMAKGKAVRENIWCTLCRTEHASYCPLRLGHFGSDRNTKYICLRYYTSQVIIRYTKIIPSLGTR